jgi:hypothetical protein
MFKTHLKVGVLIPNCFLEVVLKMVSAIRLILLVVLKLVNGVSWLIRDQSGHHLAKIKFLLRVDLLGKPNSLTTGREGDGK